MLGECFGSVWYVVSSVGLVVWWIVLFMLFLLSRFGLVVLMMVFCVSVVRLVMMMCRVMVCLLEGMYVYMCWLVWSVW